MKRAGVEPGEGFPSWVFHELVCVSVLTITRDPCLQLEFKIQTFSRQLLGERAIIFELERALEGAFEVVTFNGRGFDVPVLLSRAAAAFEHAPMIAKLHAQPRHARSTHVDLLEEITNHGSCPKVRLQDFCASLAIPVKFDCHGSEVADLAANGEWSRIAHYCEADVMATYLALQAWRGAERGDNRLLLDTWGSVVKWVQNGGTKLAHLQPFAAIPAWPTGGGPLGNSKLRLA